MAACVVESRRVTHEVVWGVWQSHVRQYGLHMCVESCVGCVAVPCEAVCGVCQFHVRLCGVCVAVPCEAVWGVCGSPM